MEIFRLDRRRQIHIFIQVRVQNTLHLIVRGGLCHAIRPVDDYNHGSVNEKFLGIEAYAAYCYLLVWAVLK
jgi:hypothetical protein